MSILAAAFLTGLFSIIYNTTWDRVARDFFGGDNISQTIVITAFLSGLGIGAFLFRKNRFNGYLQYGLLELSIGLWGYFSTDTFVLTHHLVTTVIGNEAFTPYWRYINAVSVLFLILAPSILMGGAFPTLIGVLRFKRFSRFVQRVDFYYSFNVLGAIIGIAVTAFFFLPNFDVSNYLRIIGVLNMLLGIYFLFLYRIDTSAQEGESNICAPHLKMPVDYKIYALSFLSGTVVIFAELLLLRHMGLNNPGSAFNYPVTLIFILLALSCAGFLGYIFRYIVSKRSFLSIGLILGGVGLGAQLIISEFFIVKDILIPVINRPVDLAGYTFLLCILTILPLGMVFPSLLATNESEILRQDTLGKIYLFNALGSLVAGTIFGIGITGISSTSMVIILASFCMAAGILVIEPQGRRYIIAFKFALVLFSAAIMRQLFITDYNHWTHGARAYSSVYKFYEHTHEGNTGIVTIGWYDSVRNGGNVIVNGLGMGAIPIEPIQARSHMLSEALVENTNQALLLGVGPGNSAKYFIESNPDASVQLVDWSEELYSLHSADKPNYLRYMLDINHPNLDYSVMDANIFISINNNKRYDFIYNNLISPTRVGANSVSNVGFYKKISGVLTNKKQDNVSGVLIVAALGTSKENISSTLNMVFDHVRYFPVFNVFAASHDAGVVTGRDFDESLLKGIYAAHGRQSRISYEKYFAGLQSATTQSADPKNVIRPLNYSLEYDVNSFTD